MRQIIDSKEMKNKEQIDELLKAEREKQIEKWGIQRHSLERWFLIFQEEVGEVCKAVLEAEVMDLPLDEVKAELVQALMVGTNILDAVIEYEKTVEQETK